MENPEHNCDACVLAQKCTRHPQVEKTGLLLAICRGEGDPAVRCRWMAKWDRKHGREPIPCCPENQPAAKPTPTLPPFWIRGMNFASAQYKWAMAGFPKRTEAEIDERLEVCQGCEFYHEENCSKCGCGCTEKGSLMNKLYLATEVCPEGKWA